MSEESQAKAEAEAQAKVADAPEATSETETVEATTEGAENVQADKAEAPSEPVSIDSLQDQLNAAQLEIEKYKEQLLRQHAELENARRRATRDVEDAHKFALKNFAMELLPIKDSMEMEQDAATNQDVDVATLKEGSALILKMLGSALEKFSVETIDPVGEKFNPDLHEAMAMVPQPDAEPNTVLQVHQKGYQLNGRLLRPARVVIVAKS